MQQERSSSFSSPRPSVVRTRYITPLIYWCAEREMIRRRKEEWRMSPPWTSDPVLSQYRFCNLRRRDDRVSRWLIANVLTKREGFSDWSFLQFTALCRWVNWPDTLQDLHDAGLWPRRKLDLKVIAKVIDERCASGEKAWTGAYMVRAAPESQYGYRMTKGEFVCEKVIGGLETVRDKLFDARHSCSLEQTWAALYSVDNWGPFMAGQVVADWSYIPPLENARDVFTWAPVGPGSLRGYNRLLGLPLKTRAPSRDDWCSQLQAWRADIIAILGDDYRDLSLMDVQNSLCECDKYLRVSYGEGRPRATYHAQEGLV